MKGVVLAGGKGTRLLPLTDPLAKEMLPVYDRPMIVHAIEALISGGITDVAIIVNRSVADLYERLLRKFDLGCKLTFFLEEERKGPGQGLLLAERWIGERDFAVMLGDSLFFNPLPQFSGKTTPHLFVMEMDEGEDDLAKYGQVRVSNGIVAEMRWKPQTAFSRLIQTTVFLLPPDVFGRARSLSHRDVTHLSDLTSQYIHEGSMSYTLLPGGSYLDCGTIEALHVASCRVRQRVREGQLVR